MNTIKRAMKRKGITIVKLSEKLLQDYEVNISTSSLSEGYVRRDTCGKGEKWEKLIACLSEYGIYYKLGFGWIVE